MSFISVFDVLGPNMIGPSSSHTAGAAAIALLAGKMPNAAIKKADFILYGSFARTYKGHGTDRALLGGIMGFSTDDRRIPDSFSIADERGLQYSFTANTTETEIHPNTVDIHMTDENGQKLIVRGESVGGGKIRIARINRHSTGQTRSDRTHHKLLKRNERQYSLYEALPGRKRVYGVQHRRI